MIVAIIRFLLRGEWIIGGLTGLDKAALLWAFFTALSSLGHEGPFSALVFRLGVILDSMGIYLIFRVLCGNADELEWISKAVIILLVPVAVEMLYEKLKARNLFSVFGGVSAESFIREGKIRAQGPFSHPILAGTVGAVCIPLAASLWFKFRKLAMVGIGVTAFIVIASGSSGPLMSGVLAALALAAWRIRYSMRTIRWCAVGMYCLLDLVMKPPAYFIMARIDLAGGSTGWHRAQLIQSGLQHIGEWWFMGTDYTRHWMPTGVSWSENHTDITNEYLRMGVLGGLPVMLGFIALLVIAFSYVGRIIRADGIAEDAAFQAWAFGSSLFGHMATCISVSYFDQSFLFLYMTLGLIASFYATIRTAELAKDSDFAGTLSDSPYLIKASGIR